MDKIQVPSSFRCLWEKKTKQLFIKAANSLKLGMLLNSLLFLFLREADVSHVFKISHFKTQAHFTSYKLPVCLGALQSSASALPGASLLLHLLNQPCICSCTSPLFKSKLHLLLVLLVTSALGQVLVIHRLNIFPLEENVFS